jgi:hypothetical protein
MTATRITADLVGDRLGLRRDRDPGQLHDPPLCLGDDLLAHHQEITVPDRGGLAARRRDDEGRQLVASPDLGESADPDHLVAGGHG